MSPTPQAVSDAQNLIAKAGTRSVPGYRITLALATPPDQYRVTYYEPMDGGILFGSIVPRLTVTPEDFEAWQTWLDSQPEGRS